MTNPYDTDRIQKRMEKAFDPAKTYHNGVEMSFFTCNKCKATEFFSSELLVKDCTCGGKFYKTLNKEAVSNESDNPNHYKTGKIECIDAMRAMLGDEGFVAYLRGTIFRYDWRLGRKDESSMEAKKIAVYTRWLNETLAGKELSK